MNLKYVKKILLAMSLTTISLMLTKAEAQPVSRYALVCIGNNTSLDIKYLFRWGSDPWETTDVAQGMVSWHSYQYDQPNQNMSPVFSVRYDYDLSDATAWRTQELERYASPSAGQEGDCVNYGKEYVFIITENNELDLVSLD